MSAQPRSKALPHRWRWDALRALATRAGTEDDATIADALHEEEARASAPAGRRGRAAGGV